MSTIKRTLFLIILFLNISLYANIQESNRLDSLLNLTSKYQGTKLVDLYVEISKLQGVNDAEQGLRSADEAIKLATQIEYPLGIGKAYLTKGIICNFSNSPLKGVGFFEEAKKIFSFIEDRENLALAYMGLGESYAQQGKSDKASLEYDEAITYYDLADDYKSLANAYYKSGTNYKMNGKYEHALEHFQKSAENFQSIKDINGFGLSSNSIGIVFHDIGNYKEAFRAWTDYENAMREIENWHRLSSALSYKGRIYIYWAVYDEALLCFTEALEMEEKSGNNSNIPDIYNQMGLVFHHSGNFDKSFEYYRKSVAYGEKLGSKQTVSIGMNNIGELHLDLGNPDSALYYVQKSLQIENSLFDKIGIAETKTTMGRVYTALGKYRLAFSFLEQAEEVFEGIGDKNSLADLYQKYGRAYADTGNDSLTVYYLKKSNDIAEEIDLKKVQFENHKLLAEYYEKIKDYKNALYHQNISHQLNDSIFNQIAIDRTTYLTIKLEKEAQSKELADLRHSQEVANYQSKIRDSVLYFLALIFVILAVSFFLRFRANKRATARLNDQYQVVLESEEKIKALIDASHDIVLLVDRKGLIVSANAMAEMTLQNGNQIVGADFKKIVKPFFQDQFDSYITRVLNIKTSLGFRLISATERTYDITVSPVFKHGVEVSGLAIYIEDVTDILASRNEKKKLEEQLFQVQKLESVGTMAGGVAHDFNNYLGTILGYSSMGYDDAIEGTGAKRYFNQIKSAAKSAQHTVQKILTFSRKDENKKMSRVNLIQVAKEAIEMVESTRPNEVNLSFNYSTDPIEILGDSIEIQQVFINLFNNAFHAMEGSNQGNLKCYIGDSLFDDKHQSIISNFKSNKIACIRVSDDGIGMTDQVLNRIFEPFFTTKKVGSGTGLGLSVVHGIIKNHLGELHVESKMGLGSNFYIYLPAIS